MPIDEITELGSNIQMGDKFVLEDVYKSYGIIITDDELYSVDKVFEVINKKDEIREKEKNY